MSVNSHAIQNANPITVLIVEDETAIREMLSYALKLAGFNTLESENTQNAQKLLHQQKPDLILLDWMLPDQSGIHYIRQLKKNSATQTIPIIMLTARAEEHNKITGLESGADDYITKPFSPKELIARIKSVLRRGGKMIGNAYYQDKFKIIGDVHEIYYEKTKILLTQREYQLLSFLIKHPQKINSREYILSSVWPENTDITDRTVDTLVKRLRKKLKVHHAENCIKTVRGLGYQFCHE